MRLPAGLKVTINIPAVVRAAQAWLRLLRRPR